MQLHATFFLNSILLGIGLAMDAFSVSLANGLNEPYMKRKKMCVVAGVFAGFQILMPFIGWICVSTVARYFQVFEKCIPWIALLLLGYIGTNMLFEGIKNKEENSSPVSVGAKALFLQGVATSIDALSVGFTIASYNFAQAAAACLLIGAVTFCICFVGLILGKKAGTKLAGKADILGGLILIFIGIEIFVSHLV